jgi:hypothetical protein
VDALATGRSGNSPDRDGIHAAAAALHFARHHRVLTNAAREGARVAVLPGISDSMVTARVQEYIAVGVLDPSVTPTITIQRNASISYGSGTATGSKVTVNYPYHFMVLNGIAKLVVSNTTVGSDFTMATSATMRNEN